MSLGSEDNEPSDTNAFVHQHSDLILILLGSAVFVCLCLVILILYLCWRRVKDRKGKVEGFQPARPRHPIQRPPPTTGHVGRTRYQKLRTASKDEDIFHDNRPSSPAAAPRRDSRDSRIDISVHPPLVSGTIVGIGAYADDGEEPPAYTSGMGPRSPRSRSNSLNPPSSGRSDKHSRYSIFFAKSSPESSPVASPPYATPIKSGDDGPASPRGSETGPYPDLPNTRPSSQQQAEVMDLELDQQLQRKQNLDRIKALMRQNVQQRGSAPSARDASQHEPQADAASPAAGVPVRSRYGSDRSEHGESCSPTATLHDLPRHRGSSPCSRQPASPTGTAGTATVRRRDQATQSRHQALMQSMYDQQQSKQQAGKRPLRRQRGNLASQGELRKPVLRLRASMYGSYPSDGDLERSRKRSHSLPNLCDDADGDSTATGGGESPLSRKTSIAKAVSTAGFHLVYSYSGSRNTSPGIDDEVVDQYGAVMFSVRYERFLQAVRVSKIRCSMLPVRGRGTSGPDTMVKCRLLPDELYKAKTRVVTNSRDPEFTGDVLAFRNLAEDDVTCYSILFEVYSVTAINRSLVGQFVYHLCELPRLDDVVQVFRNLEKPNKGKYRIRRSKKSY